MSRPLFGLAPLPPSLACPPAPLKGGFPINWQKAYIIETKNGMGHAMA